VKRLAPLLLMLLAGCGGKTGTLTLTVVVSPTDDPFAQATQVRFTIGDAKHVKTVPVTGGHFTLSLSQGPETAPGIVLVEALDSAGNVVAHGQTPQLDLSAVDQAVSVWVGRPGKVATAPSALPSARTDMAMANITGLGVLFAGGHDATGAPIGDTAVYDVFTQAIITTTMMSKPRASAAGGPVAGAHGIVFGGITTGGAPDGTMELFDPSQGLGVWTPVQTGSFAARSAPASVLLASGSVLISGGADANGNPLGDAGLVTASGTIAITPVATPMAAPRVGHAVAPAHFGDGDGAILFGGLAAGSVTPLPVAERLVGQTFSSYDVGTQDNRTGATATTMPSGDVLILGGHTATGAVATGLVITPGPPATVTPLPMALSVARDGHTASLAGGTLVVCGGADASGTLQGTCDLLDATSYAIKGTVPMAAARKHHSAAVLENGLVVLAGGVGSDGNPLASIEIYTP
jgi:hypothetical protein